MANMDMFGKVKTLMETIGDYSKTKYKKTKEFNQTYRTRTARIVSDPDITVPDGNNGASISSTMSAVLGKYGVKINDFDNDADILYLAPINPNMKYKVGQSVIIAYWGDLSSAKIIGLNN